MDVGKVSRRSAASSTKSTQPKPKKEVASDPLDRVEKEIADLSSGKIKYSKEIQEKIRPGKLTAKNFPCQKYVLHAGKNPLEATKLPTEIVPHGEKARYKDSVTEQSKLSDKENLQDLKERVKSIHTQADELYAQHNEGLLVLLEGDNADGKDGMLKHVFQLNPQTTSGQHAFKGASAEEREHDANWRIMNTLPGPGQIGFHNRSAYGDVVFACKTEEEKRAREAGIKEMEYGLTMGLPMTPEGHIALPDAHGKVDPSSIQRPPMRILKVLIHTSKPEQAARLAERLLNEKKLYKESQADIDGHEAHNDVQTSFANAMAAGSAPYSPTYIIPNDNKDTGWRKMAQITDEVLQDMDPQRPGYTGGMDQAARKAAAEPLLAEVDEALAHKKHH